MKSICTKAPSKALPISLVDLHPEDYSWTVLRGASSHRPMVSSGGRPWAPPTCAYFEFRPYINRLGLKRTIVAEGFPPRSKGRRTLVARYRCLLQFHTLAHVLIHWIPRGISWRNCLRLGLKERPRCGIYRCRHHHFVSGPWHLGSRQSFRTFANVHASLPVP